MVAPAWDVAIPQVHPSPSVLADAKQEIPILFDWFSQFTSLCFQGKGSEYLAVRVPGEGETTSIEEARVREESGEVVVQSKRHLESSSDFVEISRLS